MTEAFNIDDKNGSKTASQQIAARQHALEEIDRAKFGWYYFRYAFFPLSEFWLTTRAIMVAGSGFQRSQLDRGSLRSHGFQATGSRSTAIAGRLDRDRQCFVRNPWESKGSEGSEGGNGRWKNPNKNSLLNVDFHCGYISLVKSWWITSNFNEMVDI